MDTYTMHYCFQVDGDPIDDPSTWGIIHGLPAELINSEGTPTTIDTAIGDKMIVATAVDGSHMVLHVYRSGMVTMDIQYDSSRFAEKRLKVLTINPTIKETENKIKTLLGRKCLFTRGIPTAIKRGRVCPYFVRSDDALFEHKPLSLVYEVNSQWQNIKIYNTQESGNMLCLDDDIMIAEADENYTLTLLGVDRNAFKDKTVLILGGGDGGLLHELLKHSPKHVLMVEIDLEVIKACRVHMRKLCGSSLDKSEGDNHYIRIDDCQNVLKECLEQGSKFDYVVNDLSEFLINTEKGYDYDFTTSAKILECSMTLLEPGGKYLSRGDSISNKESIEAFENDVGSNGLQFEKFIIDIPSFGEKYCLFEVWKPDQQNGHM